MSLRVVFRAVAKLEFNEAASWYEARRAGLGEDFVAEVRGVLHAIADRPTRYPVAAGDTREAVLVRFPYCVYYRVRPGRAVVVGVLHTSRDPAVWQSRG